METMRKRRLKVAAGEQMSEVLIKQDMEWLAEDSHATDLANKEFELNEELLRSIKNEEDPDHADAEDHAVQGFTPVPQTDEWIKTELVLDDLEEFADIVNDSEAKADDQQLRASISDKSETTELSSRSDAPESLQKARKGPTRGERLFKCDLCPRAFSVKQGLERHLRTHAKDRKREFACDLCEKSFFSNDNLKSHKIQKHSERELKCEFCVRTCKRKSDLNRHLLTHSKSFVCEVCGSTFTRKESLEKHMLAKHFDKALSITPVTKTDRKREFGCDLCEKRFYSMNNLKSHKVQKHSERELKCDLCPRSFKSNWMLKTHRETHSKDRKRDFACDLCEKKFYNKNNLGIHKNSHTRKPYPCKVCGYRFREKRGLKKHMLRREHFDETTRITPQAPNDDAVPTKTELMSDEEFIDEGNDRDSVSYAEGTKQSALAIDDEQGARVAKAENSVTCEVCHNSFPRDLIETHKRMNHGGKSCKCEFRPRHPSTRNDNRPRPYACQQCGLAFRKKHYLNKHMINKHTKNRVPEFNCKLCEKKFYSKQGRKFHMRAHTGETVSCEVCGVNFLRENSLQEHILRKHTRKTQQFTPEPQKGNDE